MYERMLDKRTMPTIEELARYCGENAELFSMLNEFMAKTFETEQKVVFPYGNKYGWGIGHYKKKKLICNVFAEAGSFTVMMRLSNTQYESIYDSLGKKHKNILIINIHVVMVVGLIIVLPVKNILRIYRNYWFSSVHSERFKKLLFMELIH